MANQTIKGLGNGSPAQSTDMLPIQRGFSTNGYLQVSDIQAGLAPSTRAQSGIYAGDYGVKGNGYVDFLAIFYKFALSQAAISGSTVTYTGSVAPSSAISNISETSGSVVTLTVAAGNWGQGQSVNLAGLTTGTWLNGYSVTLLVGTTSTSLIFNDPTSHGTQTSHSETGTATINFAGYTFTIAGFTNAGNNGAFTITSNTSTTLVCTNASGVNETHAATAGSNTVDCPGQSFLTNATVGQIVFGSNLQAGGFSTSTTVILGQGTISAVNSNTQITCSAGATSAGAQFCLVWGDDESTALTNAWNASVAAITQLILPGVNSNGNGPAVILVQSAQLCTTTNPNNAGAGTGANRSGYGAQGGGINATYIVPTPNFSTASAVNSTCFLYTPNGANFHDFTIFGGGNSAPGSAYLTLIGAQVTCADNAIIQDMGFLAWGANGTNGLGVGLQLAGGEIMARRVDSDMFGQIACKCTTGSQIYTPIELVECTFWDNAYINLYISGAQQVNSYGCNMGNANSSGNGQGVAIVAAGVWYDFGSYIGVGTTLTYPNGGVLVGFSVINGTNLSSTGTAVMFGTNVRCPLSSGGHVVYVNTGSFATIAGCNLATTSPSAFLIGNSGTLTDGGGNTFSNGSATLYTGAGLLNGALSITGTAQVSTHVALANFGSNPTVTAVSGNTRVQQFTITVGTTPTGTPSIVVTFPTPFLVAPIANLIQVGGNNALPSTAATFTPTTITATSATFTYDGTLTGGDTLICQLYADIS